MEIPPDFNESVKPRWNWEINVPTMISIMVAAITLYTNSKVSEANNEWRFKTLEEAEKRHEFTENKLSETQLQMSKTVDRLGMTVDYLAKAKP